MATQYGQACVSGDARVVELLDRRPGHRDGAHRGQMAQPTCQVSWRTLGEAIGVRAALSRVDPVDAGHDPFGPANSRATRSDDLAYERTCPVPDHQVLGGGPAPEGP